MHWTPEMFGTFLWWLMVFIGVAVIAYLPGFFRWMTGTVAIFWRIVGLICVVVLISSIPRLISRMPMDLNIGEIDTLFLLIANHLRPFPRCFPVYLAWPQMFSVMAASFISLVALSQARNCRLQWKGSYCRLCWIMLLAAVIPVVVFVLFVPMDYWVTPPGFVEFRMPSAAKIIAGYGLVDDRRNPFFSSSSVTGESDYPFDNAWFNRRGINRLQSINKGERDPELERIIIKEQSLCLTGPSLCVYECSGKTNAIGLREWHNFASSGHSEMNILFLERNATGWIILERLHIYRDPEIEFFDSPRNISAAAVVLLTPLFLLLFLFVLNRRTDLRTGADSPRYLTFLMLPSAYILLLGTQTFHVFRIWMPAVPRMIVLWPAGSDLVRPLLKSLILPLGTLGLAYATYRFAAWREKISRRRADQQASSKDVRNTSNG